MLPLTDLDLLSLSKIRVYLLENKFAQFVKSNVNLYSFYRTTRPATLSYEPILMRHFDTAS